MTTKMKVSTLLSGILIGCAVTSCIRDEALNVEAAIDGCTGDYIRLVTINNTSHTINISLGAENLSKQELFFTLADNASLQINDLEENDEQATLQADTTWRCLFDFSQNTERELTVLSESGTTSVTYNLSVATIELPTEYSFENLKSTDPYDIFYVKDEDSFIEWASGNPGFNLCGMASTHTDYPTAQDENGYSGKYVKLTTRDTGDFGTQVNMPIAAGNLFIGSFEVQNAVLAPREAIHFGYLFTKKPVRMTGYYKYKAGDTFTDEDGNEVNGEADKGDIYAALYEAGDDDYTLDGNLFPLEGGMDENIVLLARIPETTETDTWTSFDLTFEAQNGKSVNDEDLENGKYKLAVVFSSSIEGAYFRGAVGSELCIDEVKIICE